MKLSERELMLIRGALLEAQEYTGQEDKEEQALIEKITKEIMRRRTLEKVGA